MGRRPRAELGALECVYRFLRGAVKLPFSEVLASALVVGLGGLMIVGLYEFFHTHG